MNPSPQSWTPAAVWSARCGKCESFDALAWQPPPRVAPALSDERAGGSAAEDATPALIEAEVEPLPPV